MALNFRKFIQGLGIVPKASSTSSEQGDFEVLSSDSKAYYHNGSSNSPLVTEAHTATLTNKTIDGDDNTVQDLALTSLKTVPADANKIIQRDGSGVVVSGATIGGGGSGSLVTTDGTQTLTNKTIDGDDNTVQDLALTSLKTVLADANKVIQRDGSGVVVSGGTIGGNSSGDIVTTSATQTLTGKTIDGDDNTVQDLPITALKTNAGNASKFLSFDGSGVPVATKAVPTGVVVGTTDTQVLTAKDIDGGTASNTSRITAPKASKSTLDGLTRKEATIVYGTDTKKLYVDDGSTLKAIGSGLGGINLIGLDSSFLPNDIDSIDAETSVGNWLAYADAAGTAPVDMTGGSPVTTITRTTSTPLDGAGSFLMDLGASGSSRQGEGVAKLCYIPPAYRGRTLGLVFPFSVTGAIVDGDLRMYAYDVTNSTLITPYTKTSILGSQGLAQSLISIPNTCAQLRVGIHIARTSTTSLSMKFDDVQLLVNPSISGTIDTDWATYTPTFSASWGTVSSINARWRREGDSLRVIGQVQSGTLTASVFTISLPNSLSIDTTKIPVNNTTSGNGPQVGMIYGAGGSNVIPIVTATGTNASVVYGGNLISQVTMLQPSAANAALSNNVVYDFEFLVPIAQWSSNVTLGDSSTYNISAFLANGTRVTGSAPTKLGEYRSYLRNAGANTYTETNGTPSTLPSTANGILLTTSGTYASADSSGAPSRYEIFVGKNKNVQFKFFQTTGRTGLIDTSVFSIGTSVDFGAGCFYDPSTGIATVAQNTYNASTANRVGINPATGSNYTSTYFDIVVSENALAVGTQAPRSQVVVNTGNGFGSTNTKVRRFTNSTSTGSAITYTDSSTKGALFTINEDGIYSISWSDTSSTTTMDIGFAKSTASGTTNIGALSASDRYIMTTGSASGVYQNVTWTGFLAAGSGVIAQSNGPANPSTDDRTQLIIVKVSN